MYSVWQVAGSCFFYHIQWHCLSKMPGDIVVLGRCFTWKVFSFTKRQSVDFLKHDVCDADTLTKMLLVAKIFCVFLKLQRDLLQLLWLWTLKQWRKQCQFLVIFLSWTSAVGTWLCPHTLTLPKFYCAVLEKNYYTGHKIMSCVLLLFSCVWILPFSSVIEQLPYTFVC